MNLLNPAPALGLLTTPSAILGRLGDADAWLALLGRLHVVAVHFPIALIMVGVLIELFRRTKRRGEPPARWRPSGTGLACITIGALAAGLSAWSGWVYAAELGAGDEFTAHRWVGVAAAGLGGLAAAIGLVTWWRPDRARLAGYRFAALLAAVLVGVAGHFGGELTHGPGHLRGPLRVALGFDETPAEPAGRASESAPAEPPVAEAPPAQVEQPQEVGPRAPTPEAAPHPIAATLAGPAAAGFAAVEPILVDRCYRCHGPERQRGRLRLDTAEGLLGTVAPGNPGASDLHVRVTLPADDRKRMPKGDDPLTAEEAAAIAAWIDTMAPEAAAPPTASPAPEPEPEPEVLPEDPAPPAPMPELTDAQRQTRDAALAALRQRGLVAQTVAEGVDACEVRFVGGVRFGDEELALLDGLQESLVWLDLTASEITDAGAAELAAFTRLRRLRLGETRLTSAALAPLGDLAELEALDLHGTQIADEGLERLAGLRRLHTLGVWDTAVTADGVARLKAKAPWVGVER